MTPFSALRIESQYKIPSFVANCFVGWLNSLSELKRERLLPDDFIKVYPNITYDDARVMMYIAVKEGILETNYEIYCPYCDSITGVVHSQLDIPETSSCYKGEVFCPMEHKEKIIVSFSVKDMSSIAYSFSVQKAKSRTTNVEFVEINYDDVLSYMELHQPDEIIDNDKRLISECFYIPLSNKSKLKLTRYLRKNNQSLESVLVSLSYKAWSRNDGEAVMWESRIKFDKDGNFKSGTNYESFSPSIDDSGYKQFYIVFEDGFNADNMYKQPYFLTKSTFDYIYEISK